MPQTIRRRRVPVLLSLIALAGPALPACDGDGDGDGDAGPTAQDSCDMLIDLVCDRFVECADEVFSDPPMIDHAQCVAANGGDCADAVAIGDSHDLCRSELASEGCVGLFPDDADGQPALQLPASCDEVILTE